MLGLENVDRRFPGDRRGRAGRLEKLAMHPLCARQHLEGLRPHPVTRKFCLHRLTPSAAPVLNPKRPSSIAHFRQEFIRAPGAHAVACRFSRRSKFGYCRGGPTATRLGLAHSSDSSALEGLRPMDSVECLVIGAGVIGLAVARALARSGREVVVLESERVIGSGISSRNSEVIHAGIYYPTV